MASRKTVINKTKKESVRKMVKTRRSARVQKPSLSEYFRMGESYTSLVMGVVVVVIIAAFLLLVFKTRSQNSAPNDIHRGVTSISSISKELNKLPKQSHQSAGEFSQKSYIVQRGDNLWSIAEKQYKDGYQWIAIAKANNLINPQIIDVGSKLIIPQVKSNNIAEDHNLRITPPRSDKDKITDNFYIVNQGDNLWDISARAYGNGYKWQEIARYNKMIDPNTIHVGNKILLPR